MHPIFPKFVSGCVVFALFSGCASIVSGTKQPIKFSSQPSGADVVIDGVSRGRTPAEIDVSTKSAHAVRIELAGYKTYETKLERKMNGWIFGNIAFGGVIGVIVDASTGAMYGLTPREVDAHLKASGGGKRHAHLGRETIYVATVLKADPKWKKIGQLAKQ
jgi:hypothetical protein